MKIHTTTTGERFLYVFPLILQTLIWIPMRILLVIFVHFKVRGIDQLDRLPRSVIFAVNHQSEWDPILVPAALPFLSPLSPMFYTAREREFYEKKGIKSFFYGGTFFKIWGAYSVKVGVKNYERSLWQHIGILEQMAGSICFFPEGEKSKDGTLGAFKGGVSFLAHRTETTIVPVMISGVFGMKRKDFFLRHSHITVTFGKPIYPETLFEKRYYHPNEYKEIAGQICREYFKIQ